MLVNVISFPLTNPAMLAKITQLDRVNCTKINNKLANVRLSTVQQGKTWQSFTWQGAAMSALSLHFHIFIALQQIQIVLQAIEIFSLV